MAEIFHQNLRIRDGNITPVGYRNQDEKYCSCISDSFLYLAKFFSAKSRRHNQFIQDFKLKAISRNACIDFSSLPEFNLSI